MSKIINFNMMKNYKTLQQHLDKMKKVLLSNYPTKTLGFIGFTAIITGKCFVLHHIMHGCQTDEEAKEVKQALKAELWEVLNSLNEVKREDYIG